RLLGKAQERDGAAVMEAGRDLDALVAEKVLGLRVYRDSGNVFLGSPDSHPDTWGLPPYSTDIAAAWQVIEYFRQEGKSWLIETHHTYGGTENELGYFISNHDCEFRPLNGWTWEDDFIETTAPALPLAICLAALK